MRYERATGRRAKRSWFRFLWVMYGVLLVASHIARLAQPDARPHPSQSAIELPEWGSSGTTGRSTVMAFTDLDSSSPADGPQHPTLVLLHGNPGASEQLLPLARALSSRDSLRVIAPDLPGFGGSSRRVADYGIETQARYVLQLLDSLGVEKAHIAGTGMSGGVALQVSDLAPERVQSVTLMAGIGVQELELLGDYYLNRGIHTLQMGLIWMASELLPHFGWMDTVAFNKSYARVFHDSDQRPLRAVLESMQEPLLLVHGTKDRFVPLAVSLEHHRIVPHSELITFDGAGHGLPVQHEDSLVQIFSRFIARVESGEAPSRNDTSAGQIAAAQTSFDAGKLPGAGGFSLYVLLFLIAVGTLASEDLTVISAGLMAARGTLQLYQALLATFLGIFVGDVFLYWVGRVFGRRIVLLPPFKWAITQDMLTRGEAWFRQKGGRVIVISRFLPGTRFPTYVASGVVKAPFWNFLLYFLLGTLLWTPLIVGLSYVMGNRILEFWDVYESMAIWVMLGVALLLYLLFHFGVPAIAGWKRGRPSVP